MKNGSAGLEGVESRSVLDDADVCFGTLSRMSMVELPTERNQPCILLNCTLQDKNNKQKHDCKLDY